MIIYMIFSGTCCSKKSKVVVVVVEEEDLVVAEVVVVDLGGGVGERERSCCEKGKGKRLEGWSWSWSWRVRGFGFEGPLVRVWKMVKRFSPLIFFSFLFNVMMMLPFGVKRVQRERDTAKLN